MRNLIISILVSLLLIPLTGLAVQASVVDTRLQAALEALDAGQEIAVVVSLTEQVDLKQFKGKDKALRRGNLVRALKAKSMASQARLLAFLKSRAVKDVKPFWIFNGLALKTQAAVIFELALQQGVESIRLDDTLKAPIATTAVAAAAEWNLDLIRAPELWSLGHTGVGTVVANMDTGVDGEHPDLSSRWRGGSNSWFDPNGEHSAPYDADGHGTQTMGLMVGGDAGGSAIGVAPGAQWIAVKIYNDAGSASLSAIHQGYQWLLDPDNNPATDDAPDVVNNSWGLSSNVNQCVTEFQPDIQVLKAAEIALVASAGNAGPNPSTSISPANYPESFAVGSVDAVLNLANSSSRGPSACDGSFYPELAAPGVSVRTTDLTFGGVFPDSYINSSGTSFAAPQVAGGMVLLTSAFPNRSVTELEQALQEAATDLGMAGTDNGYGYGLLDVMAGYDLLLNPAVCTDTDSDGFFAEADCGTSVDCNDQDFTINPATCDIKRDGIDQDCDGQDRTKGKACSDGGSDGGDTGGSEGKGKTCSDGLDNDGDDLIDCADPDCSKSRQCR
jgi:serine protease AprX